MPLRYITNNLDSGGVLELLERYAEWGKGVQRFPREDQRL